MKRSLWLLTLGTLFTTLNLPVAGHDLLADWLGYLLFALGVMGLFPGEGRTPSNPAAGRHRAGDGSADAGGLLCRSHQHAVHRP